MKAVIRDSMHKKTSYKIFSVILDAISPKISNLTATNGETRDVPYAATYASTKDAANRAADAATCEAVRIALDENGY